MLACNNSSRCRRAVRFLTLAASPAPVQMLSDISMSFSLESEYFLPSDPRNSHFDQLESSLQPLVNKFYRTLELLSFPAKQEKLFLSFIEAGCSLFFGPAYSCRRFHNTFFLYFYPQVSPFRSASLSIPVNSYHSFFNTEFGFFAEQ